MDQGHGSWHTPHPGGHQASSASSAVGRQVVVSDAAIVQFGVAVDGGGQVPQRRAVVEPSISVLNGVSRELHMDAGVIADTAITELGRHGLRQDGE